MRLTKMILVVAIFAIAMAFSVESQSAMGWYDCKVLKAGPAGTGSTTNFLLEYVSGNWPGTTKSQIWFAAATNREKEMLAIALTALANTLTLQVRTDPALPISDPGGGASTNRPIVSMYLK